MSKEAPNHQAAQAEDRSVATELLRNVLENNSGALTAANQQMILVSNSSPDAVPALIRTFEKRDGEWQQVFGETNASGAKNGFAPFDEKKEGDGRAPSGIFAIERTFGYHPSIDTSMPYSQLTERDYWIDDVAADQYNQWLQLDEEPAISHERMKRPDHLYEYGIVVEYNVDPTEKGKGSAIFLHVERAPGAATVGCIATSMDDIVTLLKWLDPSKKPVIVMGTEQDLKSATLH